MQEINIPNEFIVFDLEWTAWEGSKARNWTGPGEYREIYDIGAVHVSGADYEVLAKFRQLVALEIVPELPAFSIELTGITPQEIAKEGIPFQEAIQQFAAFTKGLQCYCWGHDGDILAENCQLKSIENPFTPSRFINMREVFKAQGVPADDYHSSTIVEYFGKQNVHTAHQGLDDALNIVEALRLLKVK